MAPRVRCSGGTGTTSLKKGKQGNTNGRSATIPTDHAEGGTAGGAKASLVASIFSALTVASSVLAALAAATWYAGIWRSRKSGRAGTLLAWAERSGYELHSALYLSNISTNQIGLFTAEHLARETELFTIPAACEMSSSWDFLEQVSSYAAAYRQLAVKRNSLFQANVALSFAVLEIFVHGNFLGNAVQAGKLSSNLECDWSPWSRFILNNMEVSYHFPVLWGTKAEKSLRGTVFDGEWGLLAQWRRAIELEFSFLESALGSAALAGAGATRKLYELARLTVDSRAMRTDEDQIALFPVMDLLNHFVPVPPEPLLENPDMWKISDGMVMQMTRNETTGNLHVKLAEPAIVGQEVTNSYGVQSNAMMLLTFGFTVPWIGEFSCLTRTQLLVKHASDPPISFWPNRCVSTDKELQYAIAALRWRAIQASGYKVALDGCYSMEKRSVRHEAVLLSSSFHRLAQPIPRDPGAKSWVMCLQASNVEVEMTAWSSLATYAVESKVALLEVHTNPSLPAEMRNHADQVRRDEAGVLTVVESTAREVVKECKHGQVATVQDCIMRSVSRSQETQWQKW